MTKRTPKTELPASLTSLLRGADEPSIPGSRDHLQKQLAAVDAGFSPPDEAQRLDPVTEARIFKLFRGMHFLFAGDGNRTEQNADITFAIACMIAVMAMHASKGRVQVRRDLLPLMDAVTSIAILQLYENAPLQRWAKRLAEEEQRRAS